MRRSERPYDAVESHFRRQGISRVGVRIQKANDEKILYKK